MKLQSSYVVASLLLSLVSIADAATSSEHKPLRLSTFLKPTSHAKTLFGLSSASYIFSGDTADSIGTIRLCTATSSACTSCTSDYTYITSGTPINYSKSGTSYYVPPSSLASYLSFKQLPSGIYNVAMYLQSTSTSNCSGTSCSTSVDTASTPHALCMQATFDTDTGNVTAVAQSDNGRAALNASVSSATLSAPASLALAQNGNTRSVTITNTGSTTANNLSVTPSNLPHDTSISADNCTGTNLAPQASCTVDIQPGSLLTAVAYDLGNPSPGILTISSSDTAAPITSSINVLGYASVYQGGYVFSINDTTISTGSIGGAVISLNDQRGAFSSFNVWSSNGLGSAATNVSNDVIPGIDVSSTSSTGSPTYSTAQTNFNSVYSSASRATYPFPPLNAFASCNGQTNGVCNSSNILAFYATTYSGINYINTNYGTTCAGSHNCTLTAGTTPPADYAAGVCSTYDIDSAGNSPCTTGTCYTGWYLPANCELGYIGDNACTYQIDSVAVNTPDLVNSGVTPSNVCPAQGVSSATNCLVDYYWTSTEIVTSPDKAVVAVNFAQSTATGVNKLKNNNTLPKAGVRCARAIT